MHEVKSECSKEDMQDVIDFYQEIFHQQDPLTRLARLKQTKKHNQPHDKKTIYPKRKQNDSFLLHFIIILAQYNFYMRLVQRNIYLMILQYKMNSF